MIYIFTAGAEIVEIKVEHIKDLDIRINNKILKTGEEFVSISKLIGEEKTKELKDRLEDVFEEYFVSEFAKMGYALTNKK